jgi:hypothetical protein
MPSRGAGAGVFRDALVEPHGGNGGLDGIDADAAHVGTQPFDGWSGQEVLAASRHCYRDVTKVDIPLLFGQLGLGVQKPPRSVSE